MENLLKYVPLATLILVGIVLPWLYRLRDRDLQERRERQQSMDKKFDALNDCIQKHIDEDRINFREVHQRLDQHLAMHSRGLERRGSNDS